MELPEILNEMDKLNDIMLNIQKHTNNTSYFWVIRKEDGNMILAHSYNPKKLFPTDKSE